MHHGVRRAELTERMVLAARPLQRIHHLTAIVQIDLVKRTNRIGRGLDVDIQYAVAFFHQMPANSPTCLAASACNNNILHS